MADLVYTNFKHLVLTGYLNLTGDTYMVMLVSGNYLPYATGHKSVADITGVAAGSEVAGAGYTGGGQKLLSLTVTRDDTDNEGVWDAADVTWPSSTITASGAVIYHSGTPGNSENTLIAYIGFNADKSSSNGNFTITWDTEGILNLN